METGFYPALGTPLDEDGRIIPESFRRQIDDQIDAGASGMLCMGTMGIEAFVRNVEYPRVAKTAAEAVRERVPLLVGAMDCSIGRVLQRIEALSDIPIDGVVVTGPFYHPATDDELFRFFRGIAAASAFPVYLYDLPGVTQSPLEANLVVRLYEAGNVAGIKSGNLHLVRGLHRHFGAGDGEAEFAIIYSMLDSMDVAWRYGVRRVLDGMFACTPTGTRRGVQALQRSDWPAAAGHFDTIVRFRNFLVRNGVFRAFTAAMNTLGYSGSFHPDYSVPVDDPLRDATRREMRSLGLLDP
jgi:4-hydroxy-tetrahydrodipicolinate synthase